VDFRILGPLEVFDGGAALALGGSKQRALLALLVLHANETQSAGRLIDELWGERPPVTATKALRVHVSRLRKTLTEPVLVTRGSGYELSVDPERIDACRFERLVREGRIEQALELWRGEPLADIAHEPCVAAHAARLTDMRLAALERLIDTLPPEESVSRLEALIAEHPYRERFRGQLMVALYRSGRQADALQAYRDARAALAGDLGIEPGAHLRELERAILAQDPVLAPPAAAAPASAPSLPRALRVSGPFVGRERELAQLREAWARGSGAVLVAGEAGIGKTRLAAEFAGSVQGPVLYGRCDEGLGVPYQPFAEALGLPEAPDRLALFAATAARLDGQLLVLDDLHWATVPTLQMLAHVIRAQPRALILGTYRDTELPPGHPLRTLPAERITLHGLDEPAIAALVGDADAPELLERTNGNPLFVGLRGEPAALRDVVVERVGRVSPDAQRLLTVAAVVGPEFSVTVVEHALDGDALDALDEGVAAGLLSERGHGDYAFTHALVRDAIYDGLSAARRARLHRAVGEALEESGPVEALAHHFAEAEGSADKAADYALAAGRDAIGRLGYEEAAAHLQRGLRAIGPRHLRRRELARELRRTRYEPMPDLGGMPAWIWRRLPRAGKAAVVAAPFVALALVLALGPGIRHANREREQAARERAARADAADLARVKALQRPHLGRGDLRAAAAAIRADAGTGVLRVDCEPHPPGRGRYECLAVTADVPATERTPAGANGLAYRVRLASGRYAYCRLAPRAAKAQREPVPLSPLCGGS
jgi:DNA-binding SARP family transcriptional activator